MPPTTLLLVRHAETVDNASARLAGWTDTDLTPLGEEQVRLLAEHVNRAHAHRVAALYASPLVRARRTAEAIGALTGVQPVLLDALREMYFGDLDGLSVTEIMQTHADLLAANEDAAVEDFCWPRGESRAAFGERVRGVMNRVAVAHLGGTAMVVTHGGVISAFLTIMHGESGALWRKWAVPNASITEVVWDPACEAGHVLCHGDHAHLAALTDEETGLQRLTGGF